LIYRPRSGDPARSITSSLSGPFCHVDLHFAIPEPSLESHIHPSGQQAIAAVAFTRLENHQLRRVPLSLDEYFVIAIGSKFDRLWSLGDELTVDEYEHRPGADIERNPLFGRASRLGREQRRAG